MGVKSRRGYLWTGFLAFFECVLLVSCDFERQPKVHVIRESLVLEAAIDRNITIRLSHDSDLYFGDLNVLDEMRQLDSFDNTISGATQNPSRGIFGDEFPTMGALGSQVRTMRSDLIRLSRRVTSIRNRTFGAAHVRRTQRVLGRMRRANARLTDLETNLQLNDCEKDKINPCKNGGTCFDGYKDFHCDCPAGWTGKTCEEDVDECYILTGTDLGCQNNGVCVNTAGSYRCVCTGGYTGTHCRIRNATCESTLATELCGHGACVHANNENGFSCLCDQGWTKNNVTPACIIDVDECSQSTNPCHSGCVNLPGSFRCEPCPPGYTGDGVTCRDIDECATNNGGCSVQPKVRCVNSEGSYHCGNCPPGWIGDGRNCEMAPSNSCNSLNICHPRAKCEYISKTVTCTCPLGLFGHGFGPDGCSMTGNLTNPCADHVCQNNGTCTVTGRGTFCVCEPGFFGPTCALPDACQSHPCLNGGTCRLLPGNRFGCSCERGTTGKKCEIVREICGTVLRQESGTITYPSVGDHYEPFERCAWMIRTDDTKVLNVTFTKFELEPESSGGECDKDWLQIHDGRALTAQLIGRFCGTSLPLGGTILSSHQQLFFWFRSDNSTHGGGFTLSWTSHAHTCGGIMELSESDTGVIRSPGYPGKTAANRECEWRLTAPFGYRLVFRIYEVVLGSTGNCTRDTLKIYDADVLLKAICLSEQPEPLHTSSNQAVIHLHTDGYLADSAFQLHYEVVPGAPHCGGLFTDPVGVISGYMESNICEYLIQQLPGMKIELDFTEFRLLQSNDCSLQKVEIFDGKSDEDVLMRRLCGNDKISEPLVSTSNFLLLRYEFLLLGLPAKTQFQAQYKRVCGGTLFGPQGGVITTPNYPRPYYDHIICTWDINGPSSTVIHVNFTDFSMSETVIPENDHSLDNVNYVQVQLSNIHSANYYKGRPLHLVSENNRIRIVFHAATNTQNARGLRIEYDFETMGCGGILAANESTFTKYGSLSNMLENCKWIIEAPPGKHIKLDLTYERYGSKCTANDVNLFIYSNTTEGEAKLLGSFCGDNDQFNELVHTNILTIILKKPVIAQRYITFGLFGEYTLMDSSTDCGGNFTARYGVIKSPGWPQTYGPNTDCVWVITAPANHQIELVVHNFTLEATTKKCHDDYLELRNGPNKDSPLIGNYCGASIPARIPSFTNHLYVHFHSDTFIEDQGFFLTWQQTETGCGGKLNSHTGSIHSPYTSGPITCDWIVYVAEGSTIEVTVSVSGPLDLCQRQEVLTIFDGPNTQSKALKWDCTSSVMKIGTSMVHQAKTTQNRLLVRYSAQKPDSQFLLEYKTNCNNVMPNSLFGTIETPNFPEPYPADMICSWDIRVSRNNKISLAFSHLSLEHRSPACDLDYVEVLDMRDETILTTKRLCFQPPNDIISEGNRFLLKFSSDYSESERGFRVEYKRLGCGEHFRNSFGTFFSPNSPFSLDVDCEWYIEAPAGKQITLIFSEIHMGTDEKNCTDNEIIVKENKSSNYTLLRECQLSKTNVRLTAPANRLYIRFRTSEKRTRKFFKASYFYMEAKCGGQFAASSGFIASPNYPDMISNMECSWNIQAPDTFAIILNFRDVVCTGASIEIKKIVNFNETIVEDGCSLRPPKLLTVFSNQIAINMILRNDAQARFSLFFRKQCGGILKTSSGFLKSDPSEYCEWELEAPDGELISLDVLHMECPCSNSSQCGFVVSYESSEEFIPLTCSTNRTNFFNDRLVVRAREISFQAKFTTLANTCGGKITSLEGVLSAPIYEGTYPAKMECIWEMEANKGNTLELNFLSLDIAFSQHCNGDFLEIRTAKVGGKVLGVYCGKDLPTDTDNLARLEKVWIKFKSLETSSGGKGFRLSWSYMHQNELYSETGIIEAPPIYAARAQEVPYTWRIMVDREKNIVLDFKSYSKGLKIYDGFDETGLGVDIEYSPWRFISSSNVVYLSTENSDLDYFVVSWTTVSKSAVNANATINGCHEMITLSANAQVNISSPGYPHGYKPNLKCEWIVKMANPTLHPVLYLFEANLENYTSCAADYVRVSTSSDMESWSEKAKVCATPPMTYQPHEVVRDDQYLKLEFVSDMNVNGSGFTSLVYSSCGSNMTSSVGTIVDTQLFGTRKWNSSCIWNINVKPGKRIRFTFDFGSTPMQKKKEQCLHYAIIYDGIDDRAPILPPGQICNHPDRNVKVLETTSNHAVLKYNMSWTVGTLTRYFWNLTYREFSDCDDEIVLTDLANWVNISSPRYPNIPHPHTECNWIVIAPPGEAVQADFIDRFDMNARYCAMEFIEFHDGSTTSARNLGKYCRKPGTILSTGNILHIHYLTDIAEPRIGFKLNVSIAICGGTYYSMGGIISSNNYPALGAYPKAQLCEYAIKVPLNSRIRLNFTDIHLPYDGAKPATSDRLEVVALNKNQDVLAVYYGNQTTYAELEVDASEALIRFRTFASDNSKYRGFQMRYSRIFGPCNRDFTANSGQIFLNKLKWNFNQQFCRWRITVPKGQRVRLEISNIQSRQFSNSTALLARNPFQSNGGLTFYNDHELQSKITSFNATDFNGTRIIRSTDNLMSVTLQMVYNSFAIEKIEATYSSDEGSECPENIGLDSITGEINLGDLLSANLFCRVSFELNGYETITFMINELKIQRSNSISSQFAIRFRNDDFFVPFGVLNRNVSRHFVSLSPKRGSVSFVQNHVVQIKKFSAKYYRHPCGGTQLAADGYVLEYPDIDTPTWDELECVWTIRIPIGQASYHLVGNISLTDSCEREYLAIYAGVSPAFAELSRICKDTPNYNGTQLSRGFTTIVYHASNFKLGQSNFRFQLEKSIKCGSKTTVNIFSDPLVVDPKSYKNNMECSWEFSTTQGLQLSLHFIDRFFIEDSVNCTKDALEVLSFKNGLWMPTARFCGREVPTQFNTSSHHIMVTFRTDSNVTGDGFRLFITSECHATLNVTEQTQTLRMPRLDFIHRRHLNCEYTFLSNSEKKINLRLSIGSRNSPTNNSPDRECLLERFTVIRQNQSLQDVPEKFCNNAEVRGAKWLRINYVATLQSVPSSIEYDLNTCGGNITSPQAIRSAQQEHEDSYIDNMNCVWKVTAPHDHFIVIRMKYFEMEASMKCKFDYVEVYKGSAINKDKRVTKICGNHTTDPPTIAVDSNQAVIVAITDSDSHLNYRGFFAEVFFVQNCNERITLTDGNSPVTLSRQFKVNASELLCYYRVMAPEGYRVSIHIRELQLNTGAMCTPANCDGCNYIELYDSIAARHASMGKYCSNGRTDVKRISSHEDTLLKLSGTLPGDYAFEITLNMEPTECGPTNFYSLHGSEVISLSFPPAGQKNYAPNTHCLWRIEVQEEARIRFDEFLLQNASQLTGECEDYMKIKGKFQTSTFCGNATGYTLNSRSFSSDTIEVTFHSDETIESKGFNLTITHLFVCNYTYNQLSGHISYSKTNGNKGFCVDEIRVPDDYAISLYINMISFDLAPESGKEYFKVIDINTNKTLHEQSVSTYSVKGIFSTTNSMRLLMSSFYSVQMNYVSNEKSKPPGCGGKIFATEGQIINPPYDDRNVSECRWEITIPPPNWIFLSIYSFDMGSVTNCHLDYVKIYEVTSNGMEKLKRTLCGPEIGNRVFESKSSRITIFARKSPNFDGTGFTLFFSKAVEDRDFFNTNFVNVFP